MSEAVPQAELEEVNIIIDVAKRIKTNAKVNALKTAIQIAFDYQQEQGIPQKVVIFTESKRTQKYIAAELRKTGSMTRIFFCLMVTSMTP